MTNGVFVTGTDTGIGKTVVSAILAKGLRASYWKPVQTGSGDEVDSDFVGKWIPEEKVMPEAYVFPRPASPHLAAKAAGRIIEIQDCLAAYGKIKDRLVVEGAGGVLVPLTSRWLMVDLIKQLGLPVAVVTSTRLGTINHTLLTLEALRSRRIPIYGVITNGEESRETQDSIRTFGRVEIIGHVPRCESFSAEWFETIFKSFNHSKLQEEGASWLPISNL